MGFDPLILNAPHIASKLDGATRKKLGIVLPSEAQRKWQDTQERKMHDEVSAWLRVKGIPCIHARMDKPSTVRKGWPDFTCLLGYASGMQARVCCVELKAPAGVLSESQAECIAELRLARVPVAVCYSAKEAVDFIIAELLT